MEQVDAVDAVHAVEEQQEIDGGKHGPLAGSRAAARSVAQQQRQPQHVPAIGSTGIGMTMGSGYWSRSQGADRLVAGVGGVALVLGSAISASTGPVLLPAVLNLALPRFDTATSFRLVLAAGLLLAAGCCLCGALVRRQMAREVAHALRYPDPQQQPLHCWAQDRRPDLAQRRERTTSQRAHTPDTLIDPSTMTTNQHT